MLCRRAGEAYPTRGDENLNARIDAWWAMVLVIGIAFLFGQQWRDPAVLFRVVLRPAREFLTLTPTRRSDYPALVAASICPADAVPADRPDWYGLFAIFILVYLFLLLPILAGWWRYHALPRTRFGSAVGLMIAVYCGPCAGAADLDIPSYEGATCR